MGKNTLCGLSRGPVPASLNDVFNASFNRAGATPAPDYPGAIWHASPNFWQDRDGQSVIAICCHIMQSTIASADGWFMNPASEVSAHFGVTKDGKVYQWVRTDSAAWCNGIMDKPNMAIGWIAECFNRNINPNLRSIGIEHEGLSGQPMPEAQYQATLALQKWIVATYGVKVDSQHIVRHADIDSVNRKYCPGSGFPMARLLADLASQSQPQDPPLQLNGFNVQLGFKARFLVHGSLENPDDPVTGGIKVFGLPLANERIYPDGVTRQPFERYVMEFNPAAPLDWRDTGALAGVDWLKAHSS